MPRVPAPCGGQTARTAQPKMPNAPRMPRVPAPCGGQTARTAQPKMPASTGSPRVPAPASATGARAVQPRMPSPGGASPRPPVATSSTVQRQIVIQGGVPYRGAVAADLQQLAGAGVVVAVHPVTGVVGLAGAPAAVTPSNTLLTRVVNDPHTVTIRPAAAGEPIQAEPEMARSNCQAVGDFFSDLFTWSAWGTSNKLRNRAAAGNAAVGTGSVIPYDPNLAPVARLTHELDPITGFTHQVAAPQHVILAHELIHADHFQRGTGAFTNAGNMMRGTYDYPRLHVGVDQELGWIEEMNNVGIAPALVVDPRFAGRAAHADFRQGPNPDGAAITENQIRAQLGLGARARYPAFY
jgi:Effector protein